MFASATQDSFASSKTEFTRSVDPFQDLFSFFDFNLATTEALKHKVYKVRGDVYCREFRYESEENCPNGLEQDEFDWHSIHCLITHRKTQLTAGCIRLVLAPKSDASYLLPIERHCGYSLTTDAMRPSQYQPESIAEISRLAVHTLFRQRSGERLSPIGRMPDIDNDVDGGEIIFSDDEKRTFPLLAIALFVSAIVMGENVKRSNGFAMMEPRLARLLQRSGLAFEKIGELISYHGSRAAFHITLEQALSSIQTSQFRALYDFINDSLKPQFNQIQLH